MYPDARTTIHPGRRLWPSFRFRAGFILRIENGVIDEGIFRHAIFPVLVIFNHNTALKTAAHPNNPPKLTVKNRCPLLHIRDPEPKANPLLPSSISHSTIVLLQPQKDAPAPYYFHRG